MLRTRPLLAFLLALAPAFAAAADTPPTVIPLWPGPVPGETGSVSGDEKVSGPAPGTTSPIKWITNVTKPTISVYRPAAGTGNGAAVVVAPGGGYANLAWEHEGTMVADWLTSLGVTAVVLKYRVPRRPDQPKDAAPVWALQDAQRAVSLTRANAKAWDIDPARVGMLGFSAGGHLTAWAATNPDKRSYDAVDEADKAGCRPDFAVPVYPGGLVAKVVKDRLRPEIRVGKGTPPCFLAVAYNDAGPFDGCLLLMKELKAAGVSAELHVYAAGGHGFGMRPADKPHAAWPKRCEEWMRASGFLTAAKE